MYYRYRQGNELSIKELIYDEMFFASAQECNDPCEGTFFAIFNKNIDYWERFIDISVGKNFADKNRDLIKTVAYYFTEHSPMYTNEFLSMNHEELVMSFIPCLKSPYDCQALLNIITSMIRNLKIYLPIEHYFVSFSKSNDNFLMWSHYANKHQGYCLIFRPINNKIYQSKHSTRKGFNYRTPNSFAPKMSFTLPDKFELKNVEYIAKPKPLNAFMCLTEYVCGSDYSEEEKQNFRASFDKAYLIKDPIWNYEEEVRILIDGGIQWLARQELKLSQYQRLLHYESTQLVGIILGARMSQELKDRIRSIIIDKVASWFFDIPQDEKIISDFVIFEEKISHTDRSIIVNPIEIIGGSSTIKSTELTFKKRYDDWENGYLLKLSKNSGERVKVD